MTLACGILPVPASDYWLGFQSVARCQVAVVVGISSASLPFHPVNILRNRFLGRWKLLRKLRHKARVDVFQMVDKVPRRRLGVSTVNKLAEFRPHGICPAAATGHYNGSSFCSGHRFRL